MAEGIASGSVAIVKRWNGAATHYNSVALFYDTAKVSHDLLPPSYPPTTLLTFVICHITGSCSTHSRELRALHLRSFTKADEVNCLSLRVFATGVITTKVSSNCPKERRQDECSICRCSSLEWRTSSLEDGKSHRRGSSTDVVTTELRGQLLFCFFMLKGLVNKKTIDFYWMNSHG